MFARLLTLLRQSALYGVGSMSSKVLALVLLPIYVSYLVPRSYGIAESMLMLDLFAAAIFRLGLQNAMMRFYYDKEDELGLGPEAAAAARLAIGIRVVRTTLALTLVSVAVGGVLMGLLARPLAEFFLGDAALSRFIWIAAFGMVVSVLYSTITATFRLEQRPRAFLFVSICNVLLSAGLTLYFVTELKWGAQGLLMGNFLGFALMIPVAAVMQRRYVLPAIDRSLVRPMLRFAIPTMPIAIAAQALTLIDRTVLARFDGLDAVGVYALGARIAQAVTIVVTALQLSWQPFAYSIRDDGEARRTYALVMTWFAAGMGWLVAGVSLLADPVVRVLTRPSYYDAAEVVPLLTLAAGVYGAYFLVGIGASRVKRTGWHGVVAGGAVVVSLAANLALVPAFGVMGAATSALLANIALASFMLLRSQRVFRVDYEVGRVARCLVLVALAMAAAWTLPTGTGVDSLAPRIAFALAWPLLLAATGFLTASEVRRITWMLPGGAERRERHEGGVDLDVRDRDTDDDFDLTGGRPR